MPHIEGLVQERRKSIVNALELCLSCTNPSICVMQNNLNFPSAALLALQIYLSYSTSQEENREVVPGQRELTHWPLGNLNEILGT